MTNDPRTQFIILMTSLEEGLSNVDVTGLKQIQAQLKKHLPKTPKDLPYTVDRHPNDFKIVHKNVEFLDKVIALAEVANELQVLKAPAMALKHSIHSKASQQ